ncbi:MAG: hypothetical protein V4557_03160 [Bacteroidota bacterium]
MKNVLSILAVLVLITACSPKPQNTLISCFTGKLVKRGICGQRVIQLISEPAESIVMARNWTDSMSGKKYENVFTVANPCDFPAAIKEGEEFTFSITTTPGSGCITCYAYTTVPKESNNIVSGCKE